MLHLAFGSLDGLRTLFQWVIPPAIYAAIGALFCLSSLLAHADRTPKLFAILLFWTGYWTLIVASSFLQPPKDCHNPLEVSACHQIGLFALMLIIPISLIYCGTIAAVGCSFYELLSYSQKEP